MKLAFDELNEHLDARHLYMEAQGVWKDTEPFCWYFFLSGYLDDSASNAFSFQSGSCPQSRKTWMEVPESMYHSLGGKFYCCSVKFDRERYKRMRHVIRELLAKTMNKKISTAEAKEYLFLDLIKKGGYNLRNGI